MKEAIIFSTVLAAMAAGAAPIDAGSRLQVLWDDHVVDTAKTTAGGCS